MGTTGASSIEPSLAIHGGAGPATRSALTPEQVGATRHGLTAALEAGARVLRDGGSALDAVLAAVVVLEDDPGFNAGRGAVLRNDGTAVLDASLMWGLDRSAGAVAGSRRIRNPILAANCVRRDGRHVLLAGEGADSFAARSELTLVDPSYFVIPERVAHLDLARSQNRIELDWAGAGRDAAREASDRAPGETVGAVAIDAQGHLAAATSTGGTTNAAAARIGDSPLIGAGTWAQDGVVAVSATGSGEFFIRSAFAHQVAARIQWQGVELADACDAALRDVLELGGRGGCIAIDAHGRIVTPFTTASMPRGRIGADGVAHVALFAQEALTPVA